MRMGGFKGLMALVVISVTASLGGEGLAAQVHHVVGGDRGWDPSSELSSWSSARVFRVGDEIWFTYSAAQGLIAELKSREEYESCDVSNPIRMYTDGLHSIPLEKEGTRYFASSDAKNCKSGLKLHVEVLPTANNSPTPKVEAEGPSTPSGSSRYGGSCLPTLVAMWGVVVGLAL